MIILDEFGTHYTTMLKLCHTQIL